MKKICLLVLWLLVGSCFALPLSGAETLESSPWVGWRKAFQAYDQAEVYKNDRNYEQALVYYTRGRDYFAAIQRNFPNWNSKVVSARIELCEKSINDMRDRLGKGGSRSSRKNDNYSSDEPSKQSTERKRGKRSGSSDLPEKSSSRLYLEMQSEIDQYRVRLRKALSEIDSLQVKLRQSEAKVRDVESVLRENRLLQEKYSMLEMQLKELQSKTSGVDRERYEAQLLSLKQANDKALQRIAALESELKKKDQEYSESRLELAQERKKILDLTNETRRLQREIDLLRVRAAAADENKKLAFRIKELEVELDGKNKRIDQLLKLLSDSTSSGNAANKALSDEVKRLQAQVEQLRRNAALESELRRRISELTAAESELQKQLAAASENMRLRNIELQATRLSEEKLNKELAKSRQNYKTLQERAVVLQKEINDLTNRYNDLEQRYQDRIKSNSLEAEKLNAEKLALQKELAALKVQNNNNKAQLEKVTRQLAADEQLLKDSRKTIIDLTSKVQSSEIELAKMREVQKAYDELKAKFDTYNRAANSDIMTALNRIPGLEEAIRRYEKENQQLIRQLAELKQSQSDFSARFAAAVNRATAAEQKVLELEKRLLDAQRALKAAEEKIKNPTPDPATLKRAIAAEKKILELEKRLLEAQAQIKALERKQQPAVQQGVTSAEKRAAAAEQKALELEKRLLDALAQIKNWEQKYHTLEQTPDPATLKRAAAAEQKVLELEKRLLEARARVKTLQQKYQALVQASKSAVTQKNAQADPDKTAVEDNTPLKNAIVEPERIESFLADGRSAENRGNYEIAKWDYRQVLMRDPGNKTAALRLGFILCKEGNFADAVKLLAGTVDPLRSHEDLVHALARSYIGTRNYAAALKVLQSYKKRSKGRTNARMLLAEAVAWSRSGKNQQAEQAFRMVLKLDPDNAEAPYELALMLSADKNRQQEAGEFYRLAKANGVEIDSYLEEVLSGDNGAVSSRDFLLSNMREALEKDDMVSAVWYLDEAARVAKNDIEVELMRDVYLLLDNKHGQVIRRLQNSRNNRQKFLLALAYLKSGDRSKASALISTIPMMVKTALPAEVLKPYIKKSAASGDAKQRELYNALLKKLP